MTENLLSSDSSPASASSPTEGSQKPYAEVDLRALAQEIMALLKKELRLDSERQGHGR
jgi:hypothetical protein